MGITECRYCVVFFLHIASAAPLTTQSPQGPNGSLRAFTSKKQQ